MSTLPVGVSKCERLFRRLEVGSQPRSARAVHSLHPSDTAARQRGLLVTCHVPQSCPARCSGRPACMRAAWGLAVVPTCKHGERLGSWKSARTVNMQSPLESWQDRIGADLHHHGPVPDPKESCSRRCLVHSHGSLLSPPYDIMQSEAHHRTECANEAARRLRGARHAWVVAPEHSHCKRKSDRLGDTAPTKTRQTTLRHVPIP